MSGFKNPLIILTALILGAIVGYFVLGATGSWAMCISAAASILLVIVVFFIRWKKLGSKGKGGFIMSIGALSGTWIGALFGDRDVGIIVGTVAGFAVGIGYIKGFWGKSKDEESEADGKSELSEQRDG